MNKTLRSILGAFILLFTLHSADAQMPLLQNVGARTQTSLDGE